MPQLPWSEEHIDVAWMQAALGGAIGSSQVAAIPRVQRIDGTATKLRFRIEYAEGHESAPRHVWVKGHFDARGVDQGDAFLNEAYFYRDLAPQLALRLPRCYYAAVEPHTKRGVIALEDLVDRGATFGDSSKPLRPAQVAAVLDEQAKLHAKFWGSCRLLEYAWLRAGGAIAGSGMVDQYFAGFWEASMPLKRFQSVSPRLRNRQQMRDALVRMIDHDVQHAQCLVHGDSHCANLFFDAGGQPGYLDWQHVMRGCWAFDVASLMVTGMTVADRRQHERALLAGYRERLLDYGAAAPGFESMFDEYRRHAIWSFMWVMCPVSAHPEEVCTLNAERACAAIEDLQSATM